MPKDNKTFADVFSEWLRRPTPVPGITDGPVAAKRLQSDLREQIRNLLGIPEQTIPPKIRAQMVTNRSDVLLRQLIIEPEDGIRLPAIEIQPRSAIGGIVIVPGKSGLPPPAISSMLSAGLGLVFADIRGTGKID